MAEIPSFKSKEKSESLLVLSDVHLGSDLNDTGDGAATQKRSKCVDTDLANLISHYRTRTPPEGERWRLVIAGDFIDFIGMTIHPNDAELATTMSDEEREHGLGNGSAHAREKLRRVAERHQDVFGALAEFVAHGHALTMVHGNHDLEFHWDPVKDEFRTKLYEHVVRTEREAGRPPMDEAEFSARIEFNPWFFYQDGVAYIEHGHQYDAFCATDHVMAPLSLDPLRMARGFCDVLLRFVVRPTRGLKEHGHEAMGLVDYITFGARLGLGGMAQVGYRFGRAVRELFRLHTQYFSKGTHALRAEHERRMALLAEATRIGLDRLKALAALQVPPITRSIRGIMASVLLDRLAVAMAASLALIVASLWGGHFMYAAGIVLVSWFLAHLFLSKQRKIDPDELLIERASQLVKLFPAAFVVMGYTHTPLRVPVGVGSSAATYINVGSWAEEESDPTTTKAYLAARTHLVIHKSDAGPVAEFLAWDSKAGPQKYKTG